VDKRIDVIAAAMRGRLATDELAQPEFAYAPSFGSAKDPVNMLGYVADNVLSGTVRTVQWHEFDAAVAAGALLVDVRTPAEHAAGHIPGSVNIAVDDLRERVSDLPAGPLIACCAVGQRAPTALMLLTCLGREVASLAAPQIPRNAQGARPGAVQRPAPTRRRVRR
jgi:rhodanese-related sulfurtransferase